MQIVFCKEVPSSISSSTLYPHSFWCSIFRCKIPHFQVQNHSLLDAKSLIFRCKITHYYRCKIPHFQMQNHSFSDVKLPPTPHPHPLPNTVPPKNKSTKKVFWRNISPGLIIRILWCTREFSFLTVTASCETGNENLRHFAV